MVQHVGVDSVRRLRSSKKAANVGLGKNGRLGLKLSTAIRAQEITVAHNIR
jgi:hypothetical protein